MTQPRSLWDYESGEYERSLKGHTNAVRDLAFDGPGEHLASCASDMTVRVWELESFDCIKVLRGHDHTISSVAFTPDSAFIVSGSRDNEIRVWEMATGFTAKNFKTDDWVRCVRPSRCGTMVASCGNDFRVKLWSLASGKCTHDLAKHGHVVECLAWAPESADKAIRALADGTAETHPGPFLASGGRDKVVVLWDCGSGVPVHVFRGHDNWIKGVVFHPAGKFLFSCADDKTLRIWDIEAKRCVKALEAHSHFVNDIDIHPSCSHFVSGSVDLSVKVWECR